MILISRSIIFTCWPRTLDLVQLYLRNSGLDDGHFQRIDGESPTAKRERILDEFANNTHLRILIMTTGTGAIGYALYQRARMPLTKDQIEPCYSESRIPGRTTVESIRREPSDSPSLAHWTGTASASHAIRC
jgi:SWI/SNF-related matrix-associated actin-dependent regulator of chromatin subfamily A3